MKKILFNDKFLLTKAVLEGRKTQTRRLCKEQIWAHSDIVNAENGIYHFESPKYKVGEVVAVAQSYEQCWLENASAYHNPYFLKGLPGWRNKSSVRASEMPHRIRITDVRVEKLQDISDEDCLKEGIYEDGGDDAFIPHYFYNYENSGYGGFDLPKMAYADLINRISGKRTWESNPYVFVYDFELVK